MASVLFGCSFVLAKNLLHDQPLGCDRLAAADYAPLYELLIQEVNDFAVFLADPQGCLVSWNPGVERLLGYGEAEWLGQPAHLIFTPEDRAARKPEEEMAKATRDGQAPDVRWHQRKDGSRLFVDGTMVALRHAEGPLLGFAKMMRDVTKRYEAEVQLRANEQRLQALVSASSQILYRMSPDWTERHQLGEESSLAPPASAPRHWLTDGIHPDDQPAVQAAIQQALQTQSVCEFAPRVRSGDGCWRWTFSRAVPIRDASGTITEWFGAVQDVTARKTAEAERETLLRELTRSNEDLSQFARIASHDLRSPLSTITQFSQLLLKQYRGKVLDENAEECLALIISNAQRMAALTADLLRYAEVSSAPLEPAGLISVGKVVEEAVANLQSEIEASGAVIHCDALPEVRGTASSLGQLFQNLLGNAIKYRGPDHPRIQVAAQERPEDVLFSVQDNGIGIAAPYRESIFTPFQRLHGQEIEGTGMGLAVCQKVVERAGGRIWVESELGQGATFFFTLPR